METCFALFWCLIKFSTTTYSDSRLRLWLDRNGLVLVIRARCAGNTVTPPCVVLIGAEGTNCWIKQYFIMKTVNYILI